LIALQDEMQDSRAPMTMNVSKLDALIESELKLLADGPMLARIRKLLVEPQVSMRDWDYGEPGQKFPCWTVLKHGASNTGIVYCEQGFGPKMPWGLVWLGGSKPQTMGPDSSWFFSFLEAFQDSFAGGGIKDG
jgi:hypothetical protein